MTAFSNWQLYAVPQRRPLTGCIPTGYEMLLRAVQITDVNFDSFQDDFDLDKDKDFDAGDKSENHFVSVATAVAAKYPTVTFKCDSFDTGAKKVAFIDQQIQLQRLVLVSLNMQPLNGKGWHIMPVVDADNDNFTLLFVVAPDRQMTIATIPKQVVARIHDDYDGGIEVAYLSPDSV